MSVNINITREEQPQLPPEPQGVKMKLLRKIELSSN